MRKTILAVCIALTMFMCNFVSASAACSGTSNGVHHFDDHWAPSGAGHNVFVGTHTYLYGTVGGKPIYKNDCEIWDGYQYCILKCKYCPVQLEGSQHDHYVSTFHTVYHKSESKVLDDSIKRLSSPGSQTYTAGMRVRRRTSDREHDLRILGEGLISQSFRRIL